MDDIKERIAKIVGGINLDKRARTTKKEKEAYAKLKDEVSRVKNDLGKLNLRLWHACYKNDYHSLSMDEANGELRMVREKIDSILDKSI